MGFAGSGHCGTMCGGIATSTAAAGPSGSRRSVLGVSLNLGRLLAYSAAGAFVGGVGSALGEVTGLRPATLAIRGCLGVLLVALGVGLAFGIRSFALLDRLGAPLWRMLRPLAQRLSGPRTPMRALAFGAIWGFIPCGLVYAALGVAAATGSSTRGALTMLAFGLGTLPALLLIGSLASQIRALAAWRPARFAIGALVAFTGAVNVASVWPDVWGARLLAGSAHACCHPRVR
jgi:hypothetical protein